MDEAVKWAKRLGLQKVLATMSHTNHQAIALYEDYGFKLIPSNAHNVKACLYEKEI